MLSIGQCAHIACIWEATARKPGNVHRFTDFSDCHYLDFLLSAGAVAPVLEMASSRSVGETVLEAVRATRRVVNTNTNLGIILLLTPLAAVPLEGLTKPRKLPKSARLRKFGETPSEEDLRAGVTRVLAVLSVEDARAVYEAIRLAVPGGLGKVAEQDVAEAPTQTLRQVMALAAERDLIARQYVEDFQAIFGHGVPAFVRGLEQTGSVEGAIIACHLCLLAAFPDSLIARKRSLAEAEEASRRAAAVLTNNWPNEPAGATALADLDAWLRHEGNQRNPGTTADLVTACLFVALRLGTITVPLRFPWSGGEHHG